MSNKVRMNISREMHEWFKEIDGKTNDERMKRMIKLNHDHEKMLNENCSLDAKLGILENVNYDRIYRIQQLNKMLDVSRSNNRILKQLLALSITISITTVSCLAYVQGWFL